MTKYIFLDFDGVLNTEFYQNQLISRGKHWGDENGAFFDPEAVMKGDVGSTPIAWTFDRHHSVYSQ